MALLYVTEYSDVGRAGGMFQVAAEPANVEQYVTFTATAGQSTAFLNNTRMVRIAVDTVSNIVFGTNPTAVTGQSKRFSAGQTEYFFVPISKSFKVSAVIAPA
jgi:uncharacterized protein YbcV (DUF1398 family)